MPVITHEFPLNQEFPGSEAFDVHISRSQKLQVARNFVVYFGAGVGLAFIGSLPFIHEFFLPSMVENRTLGSWIFSILSTVLIFAAVTGIRVDLTRIFKENADKERRNRDDFEYGVLEVFKEHYPAIGDRPHYVMNGLSTGETGWYERTEKGEFTYMIRLKRTTVQLTVKNEKPTPSLLKS